MSVFCASKEEAKWCYFSSSTYSVRNISVKSPSENVLQRQFINLNSVVNALFC